MQVNGRLPGCLPDATLGCLTGPAVVLVLGKLLTCIAAHALHVKPDMARHRAAIVAHNRSAHLRLEGCLRQPMAGLQRCIHPLRCQQPCARRDRQEHLCHTRTPVSDTRINNIHALRSLAVCLVQTAVHWPILRMANRSYACLRGACNCNRTKPGSSCGSPVSQQP